MSVDKNVGKSLQAWAIKAAYGVILDWTYSKSAQAAWNRYFRNSCRGERKNDRTKPKGYKAVRVEVREKAGGRP